MVSCERNHPFQGCRGPRETCCAALCARLFFNVLLVSTGPKTHPKLWKQFLGHYGGPGGNVKTMVSCTQNHYFDGWTESRETSCATFRTQCFLMCFSEQLFPDFFPIGFQRGSRGTTHDRLFRTLFPSWLLGGRLGGPGGARVAKIRPKITKNTPKSILK